MVMQVMGISCKYRGSCSPPLCSLVPNRGSGTPAVYGAYLRRRHQVERGGLWKQTDFQTVHDLSVQPSAGPFSPAQFSRSVVSNSSTPWTAARQASLSITNSQSLLKLTSIASVMPSNQLILCRHLLLPPSMQHDL